MQKKSPQPIHHNSSITSTPTNMFIQQQKMWLWTHTAHSNFPCAKVQKKCQIQAEKWYKKLKNNKKRSVKTINSSATSAVWPQHAMSAQKPCAVDNRQQIGQTHQSAPTVARNKQKTLPLFKEGQRGGALLATTGKFVQTNAEANLFALCWVQPNLDKINFSSPKECALALSFSSPKECR